MDCPRSILIIPAFFPTEERPTLGIFFRDQAELLGKLGYDVHVVHVETRPLRQLGIGPLRRNHFQRETIRHARFTEHRQRGWNTGIQTAVGSAVWSWQAGRVARGVIRRLNGTFLVHAHNAVLAGAAARSVAKRNRCPFVITEHSSAVLSDRLRPFERRQAVAAYRSAAGVAAVSKALGNRIHQLTAGKVSPTVIPNPVDLGLFQLAGPRSRRGVCQFAMVCNLVPIKRIDLAIQAIAGLRSEGIPATLRIGGIGPAEGNLRTLAERLGIQDAVTFLGSTERSGAAALIADSDCLLVTSDHETFSMIAAEAMAMGRPVIATDCGGPRDFILPGTGLLVPTDNLTALQQAMRSVVDGWQPLDPSRIRTHIAGICGEPAVGELLHSLYESCNCGSAVTRRPPPHAIVGQ